MQRRYVWKATRVRDLLDSLYREYPSGTILVWETDEEVQEKELAIKNTKTPLVSQRLLLLDGQQRITSLAAVLSGNPVYVRKRRKPIDILFNLEHPEGPPTEITEVDETDVSEDFGDLEDRASAEMDVQKELQKKTFVVASRALKNNPLWIPVSDVFKKSDSELLRPIGINSDDDRWDKYSRRLNSLRKIKEYEYTMDVLDRNKSYIEVTEIFVRVNSLGIKLRGSDLALAQITSKWKGFMNEMENFTERFKEDGDYISESGLPVRAMIVFATNQSKFETVNKISKKTLEDSWDLAQRGLEFAVNFVRSNAGVDKLSLISSPFLLIPIGFYAVRNKESLSKEEEKGLLRWFYLAHMHGHYSMGSSETILNQDISVLAKTKSIKELINTLEQHIKQVKVNQNTIANKGTGSPLFSMLYMVLKQNGAKDWLSGLPLSTRHLGKSHSLQYHHVFPKAILKKQNLEKKEVNEIANLAFIGGKTNRSISDKEPKVYFEDLVKRYGESALVSQLIPMDKSLWEISNYKKFLEYRRARIAEEINQFVSKYE